MEKALSIKQIEETVKDKLVLGPVDAIILAFAPYAGEPTSVEAAYLRRWDDYDFHSGHYVDVFNAGYARYGDNRPRETKIDVSSLFGVTGYFYPKLFHEIRSFISMKTRQEWNYSGGVDFLFFSTNPDIPSTPIEWSKAIALRSNDLVPTIFRDVDELARTVFNLAQAKNGRFEPKDFRDEVGRRRLRDRLGAIGSVLGPKIVDLGAKIFLGKP